MKKKMIVLAVIGLLSVGASAGQIYWLYGGARTHDPLTGQWDGATTPNNGGANLAGAIAYLFVGSLDAASISAAIVSGSFITAYANTSAVTGTSGSTDTQLYGNYVSQVVTAYVVAFDNGPYSPLGEGNYWISSAITKTFGAAPGNQFFAFAMTTASSWTHYAVPEPTSVALLALGAAVVGLRRRFKA